MAEKETGNYYDLQGSSNYPAQEETHGPPVYVNPESMLMNDELVDYMFGVNIRVGQDEVTY